MLLAYNTKSDYLNKVLKKSEIRKFLLDITSTKTTLIDEITDKKMVFDNKKQIKINGEAIHVQYKRLKSKIKT
jgi:hypothetical protein